MKLKIIDRWGNFLDANFEPNNSVRSVDEFAPLFGNTFYEIYVRGEYEREDCKILPEDVVVDIGANVGMFARLAGLRGASQIFCFEPDSKNFSCLVENAPKNCILYNMGIMGKEGKSVV